MAHPLFRIACGAAALAFLPVTPVSGQVARDTIDVLYVGNSFVYFNNLPDMVVEISKALDGPVVRSTAHTHGGATLRAHLEDGHLPGLISRGPAEGAWDWVVLQEQSTLGTTYDQDSGVLGSPDSFHSATRDLAGMIAGEGATPVLYMTWAKQAFPTQSATLSQAYRSIGTELDVTVAAVGEAWAEVRRIRPDFNLYLSDGSHPNAAGSYLAACVFYAVLTGTSPVGAPRELTGAPWDFAGRIESSQPTVLVSLSATDAEFLQRIAWQVAGTQADGRR